MTDDFEATHALAIGCVQAGRLAEALAAFRRCAELRPDRADAHYNLGSACRDSGDLGGALAAYRRAAELQPSWAEAQMAVGMVLRELGRPDEALAALSAALALKEDPDTRYELGHLRTGIGDWREAVAHFSRAVELRPGFVQARWAMTMAQLPAIEEAGVDIAERRTAFSRELDALDRALRAAPPQEAFRAVAVQQPFFLAYQEAPNRELLERYGRLCCDLMRPWQQAMRLGPRPRAKRGAMRIGIVSAHFYHHSVWSIPTRGWVERLDRRRFELELFHLAGRQDAETQLARSRAARFHEGRRGFEEWARAIDAAALDVLVYPEVGMDATTAKLAALRLAPLQLVSWGHPETSGMPTLDYYLSAAALEPPGAQANYSERLEALPGLGSWIPRVARPALALPLPEGRPLLVCPGMPHKYSARHDRLFTAIARRLPGARLVFFRNQPPHVARKLEARLQAAFAAQRLELARHAVFLDWMNLETWRGLLARADLYLDSVGFSGFNTALQALECGLPIVTHEGAFLRGRLASGLLRHLGLDEMIASSEDAYVELAVALAGDAERRAELRRRIERSREKLYEDAAPVRALEAFLERSAGR